ncbi:hypothetical protein RGQ13_18780 [Thalassotalea psychrophila]|uniref:Uncharacterized protein n=1 Tax=Thalassotalea psychrophila TaxID=3065647 RepID=A0ABY9TTK2_9GAMM|nr:hypothetical protein RGQ13_18780 [Colwelliaceae bacterium SQ149]
MNKLNQLFITLMLTIALTACGEPPILPPAKPLSASQEQLQQIPNIDKGQHQVVTIRDIILFNADTERELELSAFYPRIGENFPLILFSHGNFSSKDKYDKIIEHWVSHGYVVVAPNHQDCCGMVSGIFNSLWYGNFGLVEQRMIDFKFLLGNLTQIEQKHPAFKNKANFNNIAATGHSFGAFSAQQYGGAGLYEPDTDKYHYINDDRIKAIVALSPPGPMFDVITKDSWNNLAKPMMLTTGTWDVDSQFFTEWQMHKMSFDKAKHNDKYALITQGADHYLGNLICRPEKEQPPQTDALNMVNAATTSFLNAYMKRTKRDSMFLDFNDLAELTNGFSIIEKR